MTMLKRKVKFVRRMYGTPDGDYSVFAAEPASFADRKGLKINRKFGNFSVSGNFSIDDSELGTIFTVTVQEDYGAKYPNSYKLIKIHYELPSKASEQWDYLRNGNIVPITTYYAIESAFNMNDKILDIMMDQPERLEKVRGIGAVRAKRYQEKLVENRERAVVFAKYGDLEGVGDKLIKSITQWHPDVNQSIKKIENDPFSLLELPNVGFMLADKFREHYNLPLNDRNRVLHGTSYFLNQLFQSTGNTYEDILSSSRILSQKLLVSYEELLLMLSDVKDNDDLLKKYELKIFGKNISTRSLFDAELHIYKEVQSIMKTKQQLVPTEQWKKAKDAMLSKLPQTVSDEQDKFLDLVNEERLLVLLGPGGAGKSWIINMACELIKKAGYTYGLYAPTARAAKVMSEYVETEAFTVHRGLLPIVLQNETTDEAVLIVDEFSMVDSELTSVILKAMGMKTRLIIVGDDFQLQSVGPGNVLFDLVEYLDVPTVQLTKIFRQSEGSHILDYATALREGTFHLPTDVAKIDKKDIVFINESNYRAQQNIALDIYKKSYDYHGVDEILLLSPTNKGVAGRKILNKRVQEIVNPSMSPNDVVFGAALGNEEDKTHYKRGDYIAVKKNNYSMITDYDELTQIINGDLGSVEQTYKNKLTFGVNNHSFTIDKSEINDLIEHSWAITIHKSQGGQASDVIVVLPKNSFFMLNANMLYTAITRAKSRCYIIGDFSGINEAAKEQANLLRKTMIQLQVLSKEKKSE